MKRYALLLLLAFLPTAGLHAGKAVGKSSTLQADLRWYFQALREADRMEIAEGLPHQEWEREERAAQQQKHETFSIAGELFYQQRLPSSEEVRTDITSAFLLMTLFNPPLASEPWGEMSACCPFHADHALIWWKGDQQALVILLCFGCHKVKLVGPKQDTVLQLGMTPAGIELLERKIKPLHALRPAFRDTRVPAPSLKPANLKPAPPAKVEYKP